MIATATKNLRAILEDLKVLSARLENVRHTSMRDMHKQSEQQGADLMWEVAEVLRNERVEDIVVAVKKLERAHCKNVRNNLRKAAQAQNRGDLALGEAYCNVARAELAYVITNTESLMLRLTA